MKKAITHIFKKYYVLEAVLLFALSIICYANSLNNDFVYDDTAYVKNNPHIRSLKYAPAYFKSVHSYQSPDPDGQFKVFRPLVTLSFAIDYFIWGNNPIGFHITNYILHYICSFLVFLFFYALYKDKTSSIACALMFIVHPVQLEAVSWVSGRGNMMYSCFALLSLINLYKFLVNKKKHHYIIFLASFIISILSKEMGLNIIPLSILVCFYFRKLVGNKVLWAKLLLPLILICGFYICYRYFVISVLSQRLLWGGSILTTFLTMTKVIALYFVKLFLPFELNVLPNIRIITCFADIRFILSAVYLAVFFFFLIINKEKRSLFCWVWVILCLLPVLNIIPLQALFAERFLYLSVAGFCFFASSLINNTLCGRRVRAVIFISIIVSMVSLSVFRNNDWKDNCNLWNSVIRVDKYNAKAYNGLAMEYMLMGKMDLGLSSYRMALSLSPNDADILNNYALALKKTGNEQLFQKKLAESFSSDANKAAINHNLGLFYLENKDFKTALKYLLKAVSIDDNYANAYNSLGLCYAYLNDEQKAVGAWLKASKINMAWIEPHYNIIIFYLQDKNYEKAQQYCDQAIKLYPHEIKFMELNDKIKNLIKR